MYGEDPSASQRQYEGEQRQQRPREGGQQEQWQQPGSQQMDQPHGQQYAAGGTETQQYGTQQRRQGQQYGQQGRQRQQRGMQGQQYGTQQRRQAQQYGTQQQGRQGQQYGQQGRQRQQRGMQGQQGMQRQRGQGVQRQQYGQQGGRQAAMQGQAGTQAQQGMQTGGTGARMQPAGQQAGAYPRTGGAQLQAVTVDEVSRSEVVTVEPDETITNVAVEMADKNVGSVIVAEDGEPKGVLTDRKIALTLGEMPDVADRTASDLVSEGVVTGRPGMTVYEAVQKLRDEGIRRLPIVNDDGELEGIVTLDDVIVLIAGELGAAAEVIERQSPPR